MICWLLGWQKRTPKLIVNGVELGEIGGIWQPIVYGALPDLLPGEPCRPTLVAPLRENVTRPRCRKAFGERGAKLIDGYLAELGR